MTRLFLTKQTLFAPHSTPKLICHRLKSAVSIELGQDFVLSVSDNYFEITPKLSPFMPNWQISSLTVLGTFVETDLGTIVDLNFDLNPAGKFILGFMLCAVVCGEVGLFVASAKIELTYFHYLFPLIAFFLFAFACLSGIRSSKDTLMELLSKIVLNSEDIY